MAYLPADEKMVLLQQYIGAGASITAFDGVAVLVQCDVEGARDDPALSCALKNGLFVFDIKCNGEEGSVTVSLFCADVELEVCDEELHITAVSRKQTVLFADRPCSKLIVSRP